MKAKKSLLLASLLSAACLVQAQNDSSKKGGITFKLSANYNSNLNYYGRTDSLKSSGFFPLAEVWVTPNFYFNAAPVFVNNAVQHFKYAGSAATIGYQKITAKWISGAYLTKPLYKQESQLLQSALKVQSGVNFSFLNKYLNLSAGGDVKFSDKADYGATAGLDHLVRIPLANEMVLVVDPAVYLYAGSQNFQRSYYKKNGANFLLLPANNQLVTEAISQFNILAYEASLPIVLVKDKWTFAATPTFILPQNLIVVSNRPDISERGENLFYTNVSAKYSF